VHARSALFDLYGDHLLARGGQAPVAALVRLLAPLGIAPPAVRTGVSRMVRQGWLEPVTLPGGRGYRASARCVQRLDETVARVYRVGAPAWDGCWNLVVVAHLPDRGSRERLRAGLAFLGYGALGDRTWVAPRAAPGVDELLLAEGGHAERFTARYDGQDTELVQRAWDLGALADTYERWLAEAAVLVSRRSQRDVDAFALRFELVHQWRKFLFSDPGLPAALLPPGWPGEQAAAFFGTEAERLRAAASRHVDACLA
jgi:phenylacetic acid degradation operon negative regulatory protein